MSNKSAARRLVDLREFPQRSVVSPPPHPMVTEESMIQALARLRSVRDERIFLREGFHSFREWSMAKFGEKVGGLLEEIL